MTAAKHPDRTKQMPCRVCGNAVTVSLYRGRPVRCIDCACDTYAENLRQRARRSGPYYDKWYAARWPGKRQEGGEGIGNKDMLIPPGRDV